MLDANNLYGYKTSKFPPTNGYKWIDPEEFDRKACFEYPKELSKLYNDNHLVPYKTEIKREIVSNINFYEVPINSVKKLVPIFFIKKNMCFTMKTYNFI